MKEETAEESGSSPQEQKELPKWSADEARWREYELFVADILKLRGKQESPKPWWQKILETAGGAALITVLIGGLLGQLINMSVQSYLQDRERKESARKAKNDQALLAYNKFLEQGAGKVEHAYNLIGDCIAASDNLIAVAKPEFNNNVEQKSKANVTYNEMATKWRSEKIQLGLLVKYYHHNDPGVTSAWQDAQEAVTNYMICARDLEVWPGDTPRPCENERTAVTNTLDVLTQRRLDVASKYELKVIDEPNAQ
jgi:hypothetical protein